VSEKLQLEILLSKMNNNCKKKWISKKTNSITTTCSCNRQSSWQAEAKKKFATATIRFSTAGCEAEISVTKSTQSDQIYTIKEKTIMNGVQIEIISRARTLLNVLECPKCGHYNHFAVCCKTKKVHELLFRNFWLSMRWTLDNLTSGERFVCLL
jgi:hypothetical protein